MELKNIIITDITDWSKLAKWLEDNTDCRWKFSGAPTNFKPTYLNEIKVDSYNTITYSSNHLCKNNKHEYPEYTFITQSKFEVKYMNTKSYQERQDEWIKANNLKVGDKVKVVREAIDYENGWENCWVDRMRVNEIHTLKSHFGNSVLLSDGLRYPYFCLEKVEEVKESKEKTIEEWLNELPEPYRTQALNNTTEKDRKLIRNSMQLAIAWAFDWDCSEGASYWEAVHDYYEKGTPLPKPIESYTSITETPNPISIKVTEDSVYEEWKNLILN